MFYYHAINLRKKKDITNFFLNFFEKKLYTKEIIEKWLI